MLKHSVLLLAFVSSVASAQEAAPAPSTVPATPAPEAAPAAEGQTPTAVPADQVAPPAVTAVAPTPPVAPAPPVETAVVRVPEPEPDRKEPEHDLSFDGRVRLGVALDSRKLQVGEVSLRQKGVALELVDARLGAEYRALDWLSLQIEADFAGKPQVKDAFVRVESKRVRGQFGQFKLPVSALTMESPWRLPVPNRGMIQGILDDHVQMLGRRQGALGRVRAGGKWKPELDIGVFQGQLGNGDDPIVPDLQLKETLDSQNEVARVGARVAGIDVGLVGERISTAVATEVRHFWATGLDASADYDLPAGGARFWLEGFTGTTWRAEDGGAEHPTIQFATARGVAAVRWGGLHKEEAYIEPFALGALLDPDLETHSDLVWEAMVGINAGAWKRFRVGLCGELGGAAYGVPDQLFVANAIRDRKTLELQVGAAF